MPMGSDIAASTGDVLEIAATASLNPDIEALDRIELVVHGEVIAIADNVDQNNSVSLTHSLEVDRGIWLATSRVFGGIG